MSQSQDIIDLALKQGWRLQKDFGYTRYETEFLVPPQGHCATRWAAEYRQVIYQDRSVNVPHWAIEFLTGRRCPKTGASTNHGACPMYKFHQKN